MAIKTLNFNKLVIPGNVTMPLVVSLFWRDFYGGSYTNFANEITIAADGTISPSVTLMLNSGEYYMVKAVNELCGYEYEQTIFVPGTTCTCAPGYTLSPDESYCYKIDTQSATFTGGSTLLMAQHYTNSVYGSFGLVVYQQNLFNANGTWNIGNPAAFPNLYAPGTSATNVNFNSYTSGVWLENGSLNSRLNKGGLWLQGNPNYSATPLGFARQVNVPQDGWYYIGVGADNYGTITLNGNVILQQDVVAVSGVNFLNTPSDDWAFKFWNLYPVMLNSGPNLIQLDVTNNPGTQGILAFEIYDATEAELIAVASEAALEPYIIFTTRDVTNGDLFDVGNYNCSAYPGYTLVNDGGVYYCQQILTLPPICI